MGNCYAIRKAFRKWWASNYYELLDSVVMFYVGTTLLLIIWGLIMISGVK